MVSTQVEIKMRKKIMLKNESLLCLYLMLYQSSLVIHVVCKAIDYSFIDLRIRLHISVFETSPAVGCYTDIKVSIIFLCPHIWLFPFPDVNSSASLYLIFVSANNFLDLTMPHLKNLKICKLIKFWVKIQHNLLVNLHNKL